MSTQTDLTLTPHCVDYCGFFEPLPSSDGSTSTQGTDISSSPCTAEIVVYDSQAPGDPGTLEVSDQYGISTAEVNEYHVQIGDEFLDMWYSGLENPVAAEAHSASCAESSSVAPPSSPGGGDAAAGSGEADVPKDDSDDLDDDPDSDCTPDKHSTCGPQPAGQAQHPQGLGLVSNSTGGPQPAGQAQHPQGLGLVSKKKK